MNRIDGSEQELGDDDPMSAVFRFYRAFNTQNIDLMSEVWEDSEFPQMYNPIGGIIKGHGAIVQAYKRIFQRKVYVEFYDYVTAGDGNQFTIFGRETGVFEYEGQKHDLQIRTSRTFKNVGDGWRQIHHHGSIDDPSVLELYQKATGE